MWGRDNLGLGNTEKHHLGEFHLFAFFTLTIRFELTAGSKNMTLNAVGSLAVSPGFYYVGFLSNGTTGPTVSRSAGLGNWLQTGGASTNFGRYGTGQTSLPATLTLTSITTDSDNKFCSVS